MDEDLAWKRDGVPFEVKCFIIGGSNVVNVQSSGYAVQDDGLREAPDSFRIDIGNVGSG